MAHLTCCVVQRSVVQRRGSSSTRPWACDVRFVNVGRALAARFMCMAVAVPSPSSAGSAHPGRTKKDVFLARSARVPASQGAPNRVVHPTRCASPARHQSRTDAQGRSACCRVATASERDATRDEDVCTVRRASHASIEHLCRVYLGWWQPAQQNLIPRFRIRPRTRFASASRFHTVRGTAPPPRAER